MGKQKIAHPLMFEKSILGGHTIDKSGKRLPVISHKIL